MTADRTTEAILRSAYRTTLMELVDVDHGRAAKLMDLAQATGDYLLGRAVATVAVLNRWWDVGDVYAQHGDDPGWGDQVIRLRDGDGGVGRRVADDFEFAAPLPPELQKLPMLERNALLVPASQAPGGEAA